jgi:hypothetical protein
VICRVFLQPGIVLTAEYFPAAAAHSVMHFGNAGFDADAAILKGGVLMDHIETGIGT